MDSVVESHVGIMHGPRHTYVQNLIAIVCLICMVDFELSTDSSSGHSLLIEDLSAIASGPPLHPRTAWVVDRPSLYLRSFTDSVTGLDNHVA